MEIIRNLWADHKKNGEESYLAKWCKNLSEIIESLESDENLEV